MLFRMIKIGKKIMSKKEVWGILTTVDISGASSEAINDTAVMNNFVKTMLERLDMVPIGDTQIVWCETNDPAKVGYTILQILQDSNITAHLCSATNCGFFDIFSCKPYEPSMVLETVLEFFPADRSNINVVERYIP